MGVLKIWDEGLQRWVVVGPDPDDDPGITDHGDLDGLTDDDHPQYAKADGTRGEFEAKGAVGAHEAKPDPHPQYLTEAEGDARYYTEAETDSRLAGKADKSTQVTGGAGLTGGGSLSQNRALNVGQGPGVSVGADSVSVDRSVVDTWYDAKGTAQSRVSQHEAAPDPHPQYLTEAEYDGVLDGKVDKTTQVVAGQGLVGGGQLSQNRTLDVGAGVGIEVTLDTVDVDRDVVDTWYDAAGTAAAGDAAHVAAGDPHPQYAKSDGSRGDFEVKGAVAAHEAKPDPHTQYALADGSRGDFEPTGTAEALVTEHEAKPDPHPQYERKLLSDALWYVDAGTLNAGGTRLADLSGNGRDMRFGTGNRSPRVLEHSGEDYLWLPLTNSSNRLQSGAKYTIPNNFYIEVDVDATGNDFYLLLPQVDYPDGTLRLFFSFDNSLQVNVLGEANYVVPSVFQTGRHTYRLQVTGTTMETYRDGALLDSQTIANTRVPIPQNLWVPYRNTTDRFLKIYSLDINGAWKINPSLVSSPYTAVPNAGSQGGNWTLARHSSGFKSEVVNRQLLALGTTDVEIASATGLPPSKDMTMVWVGRRYGSSSTGATIDTRKSIPADAGSFTTDIGQTGSSLYWVDGTTQSSIVSLTHSGSASGQHIVAARFFDGDAQLMLNEQWSSVIKGYNLYFAGNSLRIGNNTNYSGGNHSIFIGAAFFDRALTDTEVAQATQELLGIPHEQRPDPHPQYPLRTEVNTYPMEQVATWSALPPATAADVGRRIHVTGPGGWLVAHCIADPAPRWSPAADSDTGWRNVTALANPDMTGTGPVKLRRIGNTVRFAMREMRFPTAGNKEILAPPTGFRPTNDLYGALGVLTTGYSYGYAILSNQASWSRLEVIGVQTAWVIGGEVSYITKDPWPTTLPGTAN
jgi:hypothetical protein